MAGRPGQMQPPVTASRGGATVPDGDSSVIPQLVCTVTPRRRSMRSISAGGNGAPPTMMRSSVGTSPPVASRCSTRPSQTVGDADGDRHASRLISRARLAPSVCRPGSTSFAPAAGTANGRPQAFA